MFEYVGSIHIHSIYSDGSGEIKEIVEAAQECELDYIAISDHNTLRALDEGYEKWHDSTAVLIGCEINDKENKNHYLAFGINEAFSTRIPAKEYVRKTNEAGGFGFLAHPHEKRTSMKEHPPYPWTDWSIDEFTGIEIWNHMSEWMEGLTEQNKYNYFVHPLKSIVSPPKETLEIWDKLNLKRKVVGIGGIDAHAHKVNLLGFVEVEVFPYKVLFKSIRTHILTFNELSKKDFQADKRELYASLKYGRTFVSNYSVGDARKFRFFGIYKNNKYQMGDSITANGMVKFQVICPNDDAQVKLIRNGKIIAVSSGLETSFSVNEDGVYRVEVFLEEKAWIYSNHIRIDN